MTSVQALLALMALGIGPASLDAGPSARVHAQLETSAPADGDTLAVAPRELTLTFSGLVEEIGAALTLLGSAGHNTNLQARRSEADPRVLTATLPELAPGGYRLEWRVISADGHPVAGDLVFFLEAGQTGELAPAPPARDAAHSANAEGAIQHLGSSEGPHANSASTIGVRVLVDLTLLGLAGLLSFVTLSGGRPTHPTVLVARMLAVAAALSTTLYAWMWAGEVLGTAATPSDRLDALMGLVSGRPLAAETLLVWLVVWAFLLAQRPGITAALAALAVVVGGWGGHPSSYTMIVSGPANALHLLAVAAWMGGLIYLVTEKGSPGFEDSAHLVSNVALSAVAIVAVTGVVQTWLFLDSMRALGSSAYGRLVLLKAVGLVALVAFGAYHRYRVLPRLSTEGGARRLTGSVSRELLVAAGVVAIAAVLAHIPPNP